MVVKFYETVDEDTVLIKESDTNRTTIPVLGSKVIIGGKQYYVKFIVFDYDNALISVQL